LTVVGETVGTEVWGVVEPPAWEATPRLTPEQLKAAFEHTLPFTIGVEEELMLVDAESFDLEPVIDDVLPLLEGDTRFARELRAAQIELITPVCVTAADACRELVAARRHLVERLDGRYRLLGCGTHPFSVRHGDVTEATRYRSIADEYTWAATRSLVCGLHVHVAVRGAERALAVYNALRSYLPELAALGANSPFVEGVDSGMASVRPKFNDVYPRSGVPPSFNTWEELVDFVDWGRSGGLFPDSSHFWWEMRPHPVHGTIEIRVADTQTQIDDTTSIVAVIQALVAMLTDRFDAGEQLPRHRSFRISENAWRAYRYGMRGWLVDLDDGRRVPTRERIEQLLEEVRPYAAQFDAEQQLESARTLLAGNGADRQRYVHARDGLVGLTRWMVEATEASAFDG
jgi:carboxylate-amine ligase